MPFNKFAFGESYRSNLLIKKKVVNKDWEIYKLTQMILLFAIPWNNSCRIFSVIYSTFKILSIFELNNIDQLRKILTHDGKIFPKRSIFLKRIKKNEQRNNCFKVSQYLTPFIIPNLSSLTKLGKKVLAMDIKGSLIIVIFIKSFRY